MFFSFHFADELPTVWLSVIIAITRCDNDARYLRECISIKTYTVVAVTNGVFWASNKMQQDAQLSL